MTPERRSRLKGLTLALIGGLGLAASEAEASFELTPIKATFTPVGSDAVRNFRIENTSDAPVAIEIRFLRIDNHVNGGEKRSPAEDLFLAFPPQTIVQPRALQTVRVQWLGPAELEAERAYRMVVEQLPVDFAERQAEGGQIRILLRYEALVYVAPAGAAPDLALKSVRPVETEEGVRLGVTVANRGRAHGGIDSPELRLTAPDGTTVEIKGEAADMLGDGSILALQEREFLLPWPADLPVGPVQAELSFEVVG